MFYYYFKFNPQTDQEFIEVTDFVSQFKEFSTLVFSKRKLIVAKANKDITSIITDYAKEKISQSFEIEVRADVPSIAKLVTYNAIPKSITTQWLLPLFEASYIYDSFLEK